MDLLNVILLIFLGILFYIAHWYLSRPRNFPPGSSGIPFVGYLPFLKKEIYLTFAKLKTKYGSLFRLYLGSRLIVVLNDYEAIKEAFIKQADIFAGRPSNAIIHAKPGQYFGITFIDGEQWKQHRRFIISNLREYGVGKLTLEPLILNEIHHFIKEMKKNEGTSFIVQPLLGMSLINNILILVCGKRYDYDSPSLRKIIEAIRNIAKKVPPVNISMLFPAIACIPGIDYLMKLQKLKELNNILFASVKHILDETQSVYQEGDKGIFIHDYMNEKKNRQNRNETNMFTDIGLLHVTRDLMFAGTETTTVTLHWAMLYMTLYPQIQKKVQQEIDEVIGQEREPSFNDRSKMPYTEATILELHRVISLTPIGLPHRNIKKTDVLGYSIPKDTVIFANIWAVHNDENIWGDPQNFRPERFIAADGKFMKSEFVIPFSVGKRSCVGEPLAKMEVFLYFVSLLQQFFFVPPEGIMPSLEVVYGQSRKPKFQYVCARNRKCVKVNKR